MGGACGTYGGQERCILVLWEDLRERDNLEDLGRDGRIIKMDLHDVRLGGLDWIDLAQDRKEWRALVNSVMNLEVPYGEGNFLISCRPVIFSGRTLLQGVS
jgi:hypothetical protein